MNSQLLEINSTNIEELSEFPKISYRYYTINNPYEVGNSPEDFTLMGELLKEYLKTTDLIYYIKTNRNDYNVYKDKMSIEFNTIKDTTRFIEFPLTNFSKSNMALNYMWEGFNKTKEINIPAPTSFSMLSFRLITGLTSAFLNQYTDGGTEHIHIGVMSND